MYNISNNDIQILIINIKIIQFYIEFNILNTSFIIVINKK